MGCRENGMFEVHENLRLILLTESKAASVPGELRAASTLTVVGKLDG